MPCNKYTHVQWLKTTNVYYLTVSLEGGSGSQSPWRLQAGIGYGCQIHICGSLHKAASWPGGQLLLEQVNRESMRESLTRKPQSFGNIIVEVVAHCFCCILFLMSESLNPVTVTGSSSFAWELSCISTERSSSWASPWCWANQEDLLPWIQPTLKRRDFHKGMKTKGWGLQRVTLEVGYHSILSKIYFSSYRRVKPMSLWWFIK